MLTREVYESIALVRKNVQKRTRKSGMPYGVLKKVYDRGIKKLGEAVIDQVQRKYNGH